MGFFSGWYNKEERQQKRFANMQKDKKYFRITGLKEQPKKITFNMININTNSHIEILITHKRYLKCNCPDWDEVCSKRGIKCKHILYLLKEILNSDISVGLGNKITNFDDAQKRFGSIELGLVENINKLPSSEKNDPQVGKNCQECKLDLKQNNKQRILKCCECKHSFYNICFYDWIINSSTQNCKICKATKKKVLEGYQIEI